MNTHTLSEAGIFTSLGLFVLFLASISPVNKLFITSGSALIMEVFIKRNKMKSAALVFMATATLSFFLLPYKSIAILYVFIFGGYSVVRNSILVKNIFLKKTIMVCYFDTTLFILFIFADRIFENSLHDILFGPFWQNLIFFFVIQMAVLLYDFALNLSSKILLNKLKDLGF